MAEIEIYAKPTFLYRYRSLGVGKKNDSSEILNKRLLKREIEAIEQKYIYCSTYTEMNDPMEGLYRATRRVKKSDDYEDVIEEIRNEKLQLGFASLCESWDNELMWAHYSCGFRGICVAYSLSKLLLTLSPNHALSRIAYGDRPYNLNLAARRNHTSRARAILSTKNVKWAYEREWRLFSPGPGQASHGEGVVSHVYLGARFPDQDRGRVTRRLERAGIDVRPTTVDGYDVDVSQE